MQEIDFDPSGNSVNGDLPFPRASGPLDHGPSSLSASNSLNNSMGYHKNGMGTHYAGATGYGDEVVPHSESEFVDGGVGGLHGDYETGLNRQGTMGNTSGYSASSVVPGQPFYPTSSSRPPAPYSNYAPYSGQYGVPTSIRYEPPSGLSYEYNAAGQYTASNTKPVNSDYHH